jgi:hypothetical protein
MFLFFAQERQSRSFFPMMYFPVAQSCQPLRPIVASPAHSAHGYSKRDFGGVEGGSAGGGLLICEVKMNDPQIYAIFFLRNPK